MSAAIHLANKLKVQALLLLALNLLSCSLASAQVSDGDDQFTAYHQDIGRISPAGSPVAPQTVVRQNVPVAAPAPAAPASPPARSRTAGAHQQSTRRPGRVVLAVRTPAPETLAFSPPATNLEANFQPIAVAREPLSPALSSFRSTSGQGDRHSALMAQVAAERQAAASGSLEFAQPTPSGLAIPQQPSLGSPIEALSTPAVAQVQPPPTLHQLSSAGATPALNFVNQAEEPLVAPSFESVLSSGCPGKGVFSYENKDHCDRYYMCTNGTFTEEACPNGLAYSQLGAVYQHCAYNWNVDCGRKKTSEPLASPGCPWQFGIFPIVSAGRCSIDYFVCEWGVPETKRCSPEGLFYDDRIKGCQWADQLGCKSEALLNFKCPAEDEENPYWPYPRYYHTKQDVIVCVNEQPRLVHCNEDQMVDPGSLACIDLPGKKKIKKKF